MTASRANGADPTPSDAVALSLRNLGKVYTRRRDQVTALAGIDLDFQTATFTAVMGPSGSGKSTLLHCASGLDRPTSGSVLLADTDLAPMSESALTRLRRRRIGFVFQSYNLVAALTVRDNILLPSRLGHQRVPRSRLSEICAAVGISDLLRRRPGQLSGGQQQRVAIARALVTRPDVVFCDEPTGALDVASAATILSLLREAVDRHGQTILTVTHDPVVASFADRVIFLADGVVADELLGPDLSTIGDRLAHLDVARAARATVPGRA